MRLVQSGSWELILGSVKSNLERYGCQDHCSYHQGNGLPRQLATAQQYQIFIFSEESRVNRHRLSEQSNKVWQGR